MKRLAAVAAVLVGMIGLVGAASAHMGMSTPMASGTPDAFPMPMSVGALYFTVTNHGQASDTLAAVKTSVAQASEFHGTTKAGGVMSMAPLSGGVVVEPGATIEFAPGGYHVMLIGLTHDLTLGGSFDATFSFKNAGDVTVHVDVRPTKAGAGTPTASATTATGGIVVENAWSRPAPAMDAVAAPGGTLAAGSETATATP
jgi:periplasmic copper chaperone A